MSKTEFVIRHGQLNSLLLTPMTAVNKDDEGPIRIENCNTISFSSSVNKRNERHIIDIICARNSQQ